MPNRTLKLSENDLQQQVVDYIKYQFPKIIFRVDHAAGMKMTINQAVRHKRLQKCRAYPDLFIAKPMNGYSGLFIELKTDLNEVYNKKLAYKTNHIKEQANILNELSQAGYKAVFACGFQAAKLTIDNYLKH